MPRTARFALMLCVATFAFAQAAAAQPKSPDNVRDVLLNHWNDIGNKVVKLAEEFPEDKYDFRPVPGVRTFAEQLRHVAFWNFFVAKNARGEKADGKANELTKAEAPTKAAIVEALKKGVAEGAAALKNQPAAIPPKLADLYTAFIGHSGEHYGQAVVYYRLNGIVPPASRGGN